MARADVIIAGGVGVNNRNGIQSGYPVKTADNTIYYFYIDQGQNLYWIKTTDAGLEWTDPAPVTAAVVVQTLSVWFDKWTPGNSGTLIHLAYQESNDDNVFYRNFDVSSDSMVAQTTIFDGGTTGTIANCCVAITRTIGGNLLCMGDIDGGTEVFVSRSVDVGANWTARATTGGPEGADYYLLFPGFAADNQDAICIFWDRSASEISRKLYDDSGDAWSEDSIATSMTAVASSTATPHFSGVADDANNKILLIAWNARDTANADLRFWTIDESAITEGTAVVSNGTDDQTLCALALQTSTGDLYAFYGGKSDGSETVGTAINIYYKISTDDGATWGAETKISETARNYDTLFTCPLFTGDLVITYQSQVAAGNDNVLISALLPESGGGGVATSIFGGGVVR